MATPDLNSLKDFSNSRFQVGQIWQYQNRLIDPNSTLQILKVEILHQTEVAIHIQVRGLNLKNHPESIDKGIASHLPFSEAAIEASVTDLLQKAAPLPEDFKDGYAEWREAFFEGNAGIFSVPVARVVNIIDSTLSDNE